MKLTLQQQYMFSVLHCQYHCCWCPGDFRAWYWSPKPEYSVSSIRRVKSCLTMCLPWGSAERYSILLIHGDVIPLKRFPYQTPPLWGKSTMTCTFHVILQICTFFIFSEKMASFPGISVNIVWPEQNNWQIVEDIFRFSFNCNTVECCYNAVQYNMILHTILQWMK